MRRVRYQVACSLDGYIAGPQGEADWIVSDPEIDFGSLFAQFDTLLMGRRTYEAMQAYGGAGTPGMSVVVVSKTMRQEDHPGVTIVSERLKETIDELRARPGKDIWLFGGGELFRSLLELGCVDTVEPAIVPVVLGAGIPLLPPPAVRTPLRLVRQRVYPKSGIVLIEYEVQHSAGGRKPRARSASPARKR